MTLTPYIPTYGNEDGDLWIEQRVAPWPRIQHEARMAAEEWSGEPEEAIALRYIGKQRVWVTDEHEAPCENTRENPADPGCGCCRQIDAHHFRWVEKW